MTRQQLIEAIASRLEGWSDHFLVALWNSRIAGEWDQKLVCHGRSIKTVDRERSDYEKSEPTP